MAEYSPLGTYYGVNPDQMMNLNFGNNTLQSPVMTDALSTQSLQRLQGLNLMKQNQYTQSLMDSQKFGLNFNTMNNVLGGLQAIGGLLGGYQSYKLAKDQWGTQKSVLNTNMMNQISSYNAALKDRLNYRKQMGGITQDQATSMYEERQAKKY